jgi:hypothetical protein
MRQAKNGQRTAWVVSWGAFLGGTGASVAANVAHASIPPPHAAPSWHPEPGAQIAAAFWPLALLAAIEVLTRVPWPRGPLWMLARYAGAGTVAVGAAFLSYRHMAALLSAWGEDAWNAHIGPLVVDGLMVIAGTALLALSRQRASRYHDRATENGANAEARPVPGSTTSPEQGTPPAPPHNDDTAANPPPPLSGADETEQNRTPEDRLPDPREVALAISHDSDSRSDPVLARLPQAQRKQHAEHVCLRALEMGMFLKPDRLAARYGCTTTRWANLRKQAARQIHENGQHLEAVAD